MPARIFSRILAGALGALLPLMAATVATSQERLPWESRSGGAYVPPAGGGQLSQNDVYRPNEAYQPAPPSDAYRPPGPPEPYRPDNVYKPTGGNYGSTYRPGDAYGPTDRAPPPRGYDAGPGYGQPYPPPRAAAGEPYDNNYGPRGRYEYDEGRGGGSYSQSEIMNAGHRFFGSISQGLASVVEYAFQKQGRPNGYILGEDAGGAFVAGLRYGEGVLYTKDAGSHKVFWQGPSIGYDFGAEGSKTMVLVYRLGDPSDIYHRFGGVQGSAYVVGGVGIQFQQYGDVVLAPIRSGIGLRLGANVGYLKYTRSPTWNPF